PVRLLGARLHGLRMRPHRLPGPGARRRVRGRDGILRGRGRGALGRLPGAGLATAERGRVSRRSPPRRRGPRRLPAPRRRAAVLRGRRRAGVADRPGRLRIRGHETGGRGERTMTRNRGAQTIVAVAGDAGGASSLAPVIGRLRGEGRFVPALAYKQAVDVWGRRGVACEALPEDTTLEGAAQRLRGAHAELLLAGTSVNGVDLEKRFIAA